MNAKEKMIKALFELLSIKDFIEINVSEVCMIAKIHRTTWSMLLSLKVSGAKIGAGFFKYRDVSRLQGDAFWIFFFEYFYFL